MSKNKFKNIVKEKIQLKVMSYLITLQNKHTKTENLHFETNMQEYLSAEEMTLSQKKLLFCLRSKMLRIRANFSALYNDKISCSLCDDPNSQESEVHLLSCPSLINEDGIKNEMCQVKFSDVYGGISQQLKAAKLFKKIMEIYEKRNRR